MISLARPQFTPEELAAVCRVLESGQLTQAAKVREFEVAMAIRCQVKHAVAVSNGTAALHLSLLALGIGNGDVVAVPAYSWIATANVIELCGAKPFFIDIDPHTHAMDPEDLRRRLGIAKHRVTAIIGVHPFGDLANLPALVAVADEHGIPFIEDAACALGAHRDGRPAGAWGRLGCFSFHPRKVLTTGEGGAVTTDDDDLADRIRCLRNHGANPHQPGDFILPGFNYRLTEIQAALGTLQMARLDAVISVRRRLVAEYYALLQKLPLELRPLPSPDGSAHQAMVVGLPDHLVERRSDIISSLAMAGVQATIGTIHMPLTSYFRNRYGFKKGDFQVTDRVANGSLGLPLHPGLTSGDIQHVVTALQAAIHLGKS